MRRMQLLLASALLLTCACATRVGTWEGSSATLDAAALRDDVERSLAADAWLRMPSSDDALVVEKNGPGGQQTWAELRFFDSPNGGATFQMTGLSHHRVNWLTFGILGLSLQDVARRTCAEWFEVWAAQNPAGT